jgi:hypothetical protein
MEVNERLHAAAALTPEVNVLGTHCIGDWMVLKASMDDLGAWHILVQCDSVVNSGDLTRKTGRAHAVKQTTTNLGGKSSMNRTPPHFPLATLPTPT